MKRSEAHRLRGVIERSIQSLDDATALTAISLHPAWAPGLYFTVGYKVRRDGRLWRCIQAHTSMEGWEPENAASLWEEICENHSGTADDPIPYSGNMALTAGLYYVQEWVVYRCIRDTINPVYNALADLVGLYVENV